MYKSGFTTYSPDSAMPTTSSAVTNVNVTTGLRTNECVTQSTAEGAVNCES